LFKQAADHGDIDSYFELFKIYKDGIGVRKNKKTASKYLDLAKENQHIEAASIEF
jgi:TPR repeat protein